MFESPYLDFSWLAPDPVQGLFIVELMTGETREIDVNRRIINHDALTLYLEERNTGKLYNWQNVLSIQKKENNV
jgi:hypothetical protein